MRRDTMDHPPPRRRIRISPSVSQFPATKKAVEKSYADLETYVSIMILLKSHLQRIEEN